MRAMPEIAMRDIVAFLGAAGLVGGMVIAWVRWQLAGDFAKSSDIASLSTRLREVERQMDTVPTHADLRAVNDRLGATERGVAVATAEIKGVREAVDRQSVDLRLIVTHMMDKPK
jgi:hypothetical protein